MDGRGIMASGSDACYFNRGISGTASVTNSSTHSGSLASQNEFNPQPNPLVSPRRHVRVTGAVGSTAFKGANQSPGFPRGSNSMAVASSEKPIGTKKKRGRPRKYLPQGAAPVSLRLTPVSSDASPGSITHTRPKKKGRPPGSGRKQRLASLGEWMNSSAGLAFAPHTIRLSAGEDIAAKILSFAQQRPRSVCILAATGTVSAVTLCQPSSSAGSTITYEGRFEILCLSGSYLLAESGGPRNRTGGLSISFCGPGGQVVGGAVGGRLVAGTLVQVVACSFVYGGGSKQPKSKTKDNSKNRKGSSAVLQDKKSSAMAPPKQNLNPNASMISWPIDSQFDMRNSQTGIDLTRG